MQRIRKIVFSPRIVMLAAVLIAVSALSAATPEPAHAAGAALVVTVDISPALKARTKPEQVVFIFAKAVRGPRAPLAAVKTRVKELPLTVTLDDSKAPAPMFRLSNFKNVRVSARVSHSGRAMKSSGDLEGVSPEITLGRAAIQVTVVIDNIVP